ncbi:MAG: glycosyltransferase family 4 protein [Gammaproteobacteria bacterium]|nr:glycosyltransferase family 4 protein [Gammaproteobacteria bacterium]
MTNALIIASNAKSLMLFRYELMEALVKKGLNVFALAPETQVTADLTDLLQKIGVSLIAYPIHNRGLNPWADFKTAQSLYQCMKKLKPDFVLAYTMKPVIYGSIAARFAKTPHIFSIITGLGSVFIDQGFKKSMIRSVASLLYRVALHMNKSIFFQNADDLQLFVQKKLVSKDRAVLINGSGVNLEQFQVVKITHPNHFLLIGRLLPDKGMFEFVAATKRVKANFPDARFTIIGPKQGHVQTDILLNAIHQAEIEYIEEVEDVRPYIAACGVYVLPSYREGTPRSVLEAMAMARPIITTDAPGCRETVMDGVNGFLVPVKNVSALVEKMEYFLHNPQECERMGQESRKLVEQKFDVHQVNQVILETIMGQANE